jgi:hypothetical protein
MTPDRPEVDEATRLAWQRARFGENPPEVQAQSGTADELYAELERSMTGGRGRPRAMWHIEAFAEIDALISRGGLSIDAACARIEPRYATRHNLQPGTLHDLYVRHARERLAHQTGTALAAGNIASAIAPYKQLLDRATKTRDYRGRRKS